MTLASGTLTRARGARLRTPLGGARGVGCACGACARRRPRSPRNQTCNQQEVTSASRRGEPHAPAQSVHMHMHMRLWFTNGWTVWYGRYGMVAMDAICGLWAQIKRLDRKWESSATARPSSLCASARWSIRPSLGSSASGVTSRSKRSASSTAAASRCWSSSS